MFEKLTSELDSHPAVQQDAVSRRGIESQAVVHAQPMHRTYRSHIPALRDVAAFNARGLPWEPERIVALSEGPASCRSACRGRPRR